MNLIVLSHNSILGKEVNSLIESKAVFSSKEEGKNVNKEFWILEGNIEIIFVITTPKVVNNVININLNFLIGIRRNNMINTANNAFLEVVKIIIYIKVQIKKNVIDLENLLFSSLKNKPIIKVKIILNHAPK